ncbi:MAG: TonB-dependent receptor [Caulobacteraceae bacterium]|nr:MAG: TonB-dependent receptor [Caulobacteraceae bacterium]
MLGLSLPKILQASSQYTGPKPPVRAKSVIFLFQWGGPSHLETFDMKPGANDEYRGPHRPMRSASPEIEVNDKLPKTAAIMDKVTLIRSVHHTMTNHNSAGYYALTGKAPPSDDQRLRESIDLFPGYGSVASHLLERQDAAMPTFVSYPHIIADGTPTPGQFASFLGKKNDPLYVPAPAVAGSGSLTDPGVVGRVKTTSFAVADMLSFLDDRLIATVGARYQEIDTRGYTYDTNVRNGGYASDAVTPVFAVVYRPIDAVSLYANYSEALIPGKTAPTVINGAPVSNADEVLEPFRGEQAEVGVKYDGGSFGGTLSVFRTTLPSESFDGTTYSAGGEQENRGVELSVFGEPVKGLRVLGGATWLDAEITRALDASLDGKSAIGVPDFQANVNLEWDVRAIDGLTLEGRVVHTGSQPANGANTVELESWTRFDAGVRYAFVAGDKPVTLRARVENVADEDQWVAVGGFPGSNYLTLGAPRTFRLSISTEF